MGQFERDFAELVKLHNARKGVVSKPVAPAPEPDEDDDDSTADDMADINAQLMRASRRYRRNRDPGNLTAKHVELAKRFAAGEEPEAARVRPPLNYKLRAVRSLLVTPAFISLYEQLRSPRSPTVDQLREATRPFNSAAKPRTPINAPAPPRPISTPGAGYLIRLKDRS